MTTLYRPQRQEDIIMYYKFNGIIYATYEEAKEAKDDLVKNGQADTNDKIIKVKLW